MASFSGSSYLLFGVGVKALRGMVSVQEKRLEGLREEMDALRRSIQGSAADPLPGLSSAVRGAPMAVTVPVAPPVCMLLSDHIRVICIGNSKVCVACNQKS